MVKSILQANTIELHYWMDDNSHIKRAKLLQKSEMRKDIVIELSYKGFG